MRERLDWRIQRDPFLEAPDAPDPKVPTLVRRPAGTPWRGYALVLLIAAALGFGFGRWAETDGRVWTAVQDNLALAQLAIERHDPDLLGRTLDPQSAAGWREAEIARQLSLPHAPGPEALIDIGPTDSDLLRVRVRLADGDAAPEDLRFYRRQGDRWLQSAPTQSGDGSRGSQP